MSRPAPAAPPRPRATPGPATRCDRGTRNAFSANGTFPDISGPPRPNRPHTARANRRAHNAPTLTQSVRGYAPDRAQQNTKPPKSPEKTREKNGSITHFAVTAFARFHAAGCEEGGHF